ncbi:flavin-containing monooxygenase [Oceaniglobus trochenteri]|uniref:flavin-containing monooxygenase n=1 Tax=Oceaniglobus trochenteri TaxID=2763260 RepID=UPI001D000D3D|nr:NAD(P)/FAD-dependent oxidoreductase [Oceaniglobus trochenteri]
MDEKKAREWLDRFAQALAGGDAGALFHDDCHWRDLLAFTFTLVTLEGCDRVQAMLRDRADTVRPENWRLTAPPEVDEDGMTEAWFTFDTALGPAIGALRLDGGQCRHFYTALLDLTGFEEAAGRNRPLGVRHGATRDRQTWAETRAGETAAMGREVQPHTLIIGGGQGGLALAARLRALGVPALVIEKNPRAGDSWRNRYRTLVLHDPVWFDHMPYMPFPGNWPVFTPKDKMGDWLESYAQLMELAIWTSTSCESAEWTGEGWTVRVNREGEELTLHPRHLVFATGAYGPPRPIPFDGAGDFAGTLIHSRDYKGAEDWKGRNCVVIGAASSAHDVAVDLWEAGAHVTMIQRSPTTVVKSATLMDLGFDTYSEAALERGIDTDRADHMAASLPFGPMAARQRRMYDTIRTRDADFYDRLAKAGFALDFGEDDSGLMMKALRTGAGYYIDVGGSELIASGQIGVISGVGVDRMNRDGLTLSDGRDVKADLVVACLGYQSMHETVATIVDRPTADSVGPCWGLGSGVRGDPGPWVGEPRNMWKPVAHENLWFHGGNLAMSRFYSKYLAMQIKARKEGIAPPVWPGAAPKDQRSA